jgi:hypothetical protein
LRYLKKFNEERYLRIFEYFNDIENIDYICEKYDIIDYTINSDRSIDVDNIINLFNRNLRKLPLKFNKVNGDFNCHWNMLITLEGSPIEINGGFYCNKNKLTSFEYAPKIIRGNFYCNSNNIKTFEYAPSFVKGDFSCSDNPIFWVWVLFIDDSKIELLNDFDIFRDEDTDEPAIIMDRLNDFLLTIGKDPVKKIGGYKNI